MSDTAQVFHPPAPLTAPLTAPSLLWTLLGYHLWCPALELAAAVNWKQALSDWQANSCFSPRHDWAGCPLGIVGGPLSSEGVRPPSSWALTVRRGVVVAVWRGRDGRGNAGWVVLGSWWGLAWPAGRVPKVAAPSWRRQRYPDLYPDNL